MYGIKKILIAVCFVLPGISAISQRYFTKNGTIHFEASTALEDVDAVNKSATSVFDATSGQIEFAVLIKGFEFKKALMQEHFNENYMESSKYPKASFKGKIVNSSAINFSTPGTYPATVKGIMEIHGVKKEITVPGTIKVTSQGAQATAKFNVNVKDYNISIPGIVRDKISPVAKVNLSCNYAILK